MGNPPSTSRRWEGGKMMQFFGRLFTGSPQPKATGTELFPVVPLHPAYTFYWTFLKLSQAQYAVPFLLGPCIIHPLSPLKNHSQTLMERMTRSSNSTLSRMCNPNSYYMKVGKGVRNDERLCKAWETTRLFGRKGYKGVKTGRWFKRLVSNTHVPTSTSNSGQAVSTTSAAEKRFLFWRG